MAYNKSFSDALAVAQFVGKNLPAKNSKDYDYYSIEAYQNGREQGILIWVHGATLEVAYYVCRQRQSDSVGFYSGKYSMQSISDDAYGNGFSGFKNPLEAARKIVAEIKAMI